MPVYREIDMITDEVSRYSPSTAHHWTEAVGAWDDARKQAFCAAVCELGKTVRMHRRVAKIVGLYGTGPVTGQPILVSGEIPPGGGDSKSGTNQLIFRLDVTEYWRFPFDRRMTKHKRIG